MGVSVIIPCRNQAATLERAVKSAFAAGADEVLIFDDASTDNPNAVNLKLDDTRLTLYSATFHCGVSYARNHLILSAACDWIVVLDADDELLFIPDPIPNSWIYGGWIEHYEDGHEETFRSPPPLMISRKPLCHATMMFSKTIWQKVGGYDPDFFFGEDYAFQCSLMNIEFPSQCAFPLYKRYVGNNARTEKAMKYWPIIQEMCREKYPAIFS